jgi:agmatinase
LLRPGHPLFQFDVTDLVRVADVGDCPVVPGYHDRTLTLIEQSLVELHEKKIVPIIIGGDHSLAIAELRAAFQTHGRMSLVQFDAHRDVLDDYFGVKHFHGTVYRRAVEERLIDPATSFQIGMRGSLPPEDLGADDLGFRVWPWRTIRQGGTQGLIKEIVSACAGQPVALSFDIDFLDPAFAPGTGTPEVGGPSTAEAIEILHLLPPLNLVTASVVEIAPPYDSGDITAMAGAAIVFEIISNIARTYQERRSNADER